MTIKEAILQSLEDLGNLATYNEVCGHVVQKKYYDFGQAKTPAATVSAMLGSFIRNGDSRVKRISTGKGNFSYYLSKNENAIFPIATTSIQVTQLPNQKKTSYSERSLHKLFSTYLKSVGISTKTIYHEQSVNSKDNNQKWIHPDMVGVEFTRLHTRTSQSLIKSISVAESFKITSYELKREINTDYDLKQAYFQAVSNSSWANYGYLVAFEIGDNLSDEISRLNQSFGIGVIELKANPYESKIIHQSRFKSLDFKTIDKLCHINNDFDKFIDKIDKILKAEDRYIRSSEKELEEFCDNYFSSDTEITLYCKEHNIPDKDN
ncbi:HTH domain-containing protein [Hymenobacter sp. YC55]|uniref:HTH domain-containing protein n=1 Tax=Hymenobacter sp. YC55 TaxID=3034019 RepID=UPI0023F8DD75|nr:HTH domain-containing protein [Hymenobacter sp. YC55]MDF7814397.1 HTH domain-containing protein [Hymenobacter sp. YC55]